jgi:hypothetical protein
VSTLESERRGLSGGAQLDVVDIVSNRLSDGKRLAVRLKDH